ncbi:uncharacterized protein BP5553_06842 [Venustampulla echinocandica]|uniref:Uncharacterized protein n=1 Tax=Venustampulla echinocandica TaxID=2656787 RepID=A0A370TL22_9HELO|nr:uncharacterized protein BP5553_06842 [Venustampulla echinocandica]RDL36230.1 hypothetical protein BP5553_06842 [Venustampulla echinocandica]
MAAAVTRFLLLALHVLSAAGYRQSTARGVSWLERGSSVLVRLDVPDLPLWNPTEQIGEDVPTALVLNFTLTPDRRTLLLQDKPIFPLPNPHIPPQLVAPQTKQTTGRLNRGEIAKLDDYPLFALDYGRLVSPRDDPSIHYYNHFPTLTIDLLGAGIAGYDTLLKDPNQGIVNIELRGHDNARGDWTRRSYEILDVKITDRTSRYQWTWDMACYAADSRHCQHGTFTSDIRDV